MLQTKICYCIGHNLPYITHLPCGKEIYNKLYAYHELSDLAYYITDLIMMLDSSLEKYDSKYQPENKAMCDEIKILKDYLEQCLKQIERML